jgi:uncharacterized protein YndB with AHSA1/START domain
MTEAHEIAADRVVREEMRTSASPEDVYGAFADPERLAQWFVDRARGEARVGETMTWEWEAFSMEAPYEVVEADPARRLVLRAPADVAPPGVIEITIRSEKGQTVLTVGRRARESAARDADSADRLPSRHRLVRGRSPFHLAARSM